MHPSTASGIAMAQPGSDKPHLWEEDLSESADRERKSLAEWSASIHFKQQADDFEIHDSTELSSKVMPFLQQLGLLDKVY